jgi:hypothetical protein
MTDPFSAVAALLASPVGSAIESRSADSRALRERRILIYDALFACERAGLQLLFDYKSPDAYRAGQARLEANREGWRAAADAAYMHGSERMLEAYKSYLTHLYAAADQKTHLFDLAEADQPREILLAAEEELLRRAKLAGKYLEELRRVMRRDTGSDR